MRAGGTRCWATCAPSRPKTGSGRLPAAARTIRLLTAHVAACKYVYDNHAFGDAEMSWNDPAGDLGYGMEDLQSESVLDNEPSIADVVAWLSEGHRRPRARRRPQR